MKVIELALFKTKPEVTEEQFRTALADSSRWLASQPAFVERRHGTGDDGCMDMVEWESMAAAQAAADRFPSAPEAQTFMAVIDPESIFMRHFELMS
jgi:hypothetical protein